MIKSFKTFLLEKQEGMLDISIPSFFKLLKLDIAKLVPGSKAYANANTKIKTFLSDSFRIEEKVDGVKLSLIRNDTEFDPNDYTKNWIVAYKTFILYPFEHSNVSLDDAKDPTNYGNSQYKLIHDRLEKAHPKLASIPKNTEFFLEFLMRKPTLTRSYGEGGIHSVIFLASSPIEELTVKNGKVFTKTSKFDQNSLENNFSKTFVEATGFNPPKVIFQGALFTSADNPKFNEGGFNFTGLKNRYDELKDEFNSALESLDWVKVSILLQTLFTTFDSFYGGGVPEGVVGWGSDTSSPFKFTSSEQYDKTLRSSIKTNLLGDGKDLEEYYGKIEEKAEELFHSINTALPFAKQVEVASKLVYHQKLDNINYGKKTTLNKQDDLFLKLKSYLMDAYDDTASSTVNRVLGKDTGLGLVVGKFRLPTVAHIELIRTALESTPKVLLALVDTSKKGLSFSERKEILEKSFPTKVIVTKVDSANLSRILKAFKGKISKVFCGTDALASYQRQIDDYNQMYQTDIAVKELERTDDDEVSATHVEKAIKAKDHETFNQLASPLLKPHWDQLVSKLT